MDPQTTKPAGDSRGTVALDRPRLSTSSALTQAGLRALREAGADDPSVVGALLAKAPGKLIATGAVFGAAFALAAFAYMKLGKALARASYEDDETETVPARVGRFLNTYQCSRDSGHTLTDVFSPGLCGCGAPKEPIR